MRKIFMRKYIPVIIGLASLSGLIITHSFLPRALTPRQVLEKYLDASLHGRPEEAYTFLSSEDKGVKSPEEYISERSSGKNESAFREILYDKITHRIEYLQIKDDTASANVSITTPDFAVMFRDLYAAAFGSIEQETLTPEEIDRLMAERYKDKGLPMTTTVKTYNLLKEEGGWRIHHGWKTKKWDLDKIGTYLGNTD